MKKKLSKILQSWVLIAAIVAGGIAQTGLALATPISSPKDVIVFEYTEGESTTHRYLVDDTHADPVELTLNDVCEAVGLTNDADHDVTSTSATPAGQIEVARNGEDSWIVTINTSFEDVDGDITCTISDTDYHIAVDRVTAYAGVPSFTVDMPATDDAYAYEEINQFSPEATKGFDTDDLEIQYFVNTTNSTEGAQRLTLDGTNFPSVSEVGTKYYFAKAIETEPESGATETVVSTICAFTVSPIPLDVVATDKTINVGDALPDLSAPVENEDYELYFGTGAETFEIPTTYDISGISLEYDPGVDHDTPGDYDILPDNATNEAGDVSMYSLTYTNGTLSVVDSGEYTITTGPNNMEYGEATGGGTYTSAETCTLTANPATGYEFIGWVNSETTTESPLSTDNPYSFIPTHDDAIIAYFQAIEYDVQYDAGDVYAADPTTETVAEGGLVTEPTVTMNPGYESITLAGWYTEPGFVHQWQFDTDTVSEDMTLYAKWNDYHDVTFNMQGHGVQVDPQSVQHGDYVTEPADPAEVGYEFGGWYKEAGCSNTWDFSTDTVTDDEELFAKWTENPSVVAVIDQQPESMDVEYGDEYTVSVHASAADDYTLTYQWYMNAGAGDEEIAGATEASYTATAEDLGDTDYWCVVVATKEATPPVELTSESATVSAEERTVTVSGITAEDKDYDQSADATLEYDNVVLDGKLAGDTLGVTADGTFSDALVGNGKTVTIANLALTGADAAKYVLAGEGQQTTTVADIMPLEVTVSGITADDKVYDSVLDADIDVSGVEYTGMLDGDTLGLTVNGYFEDKNAGEDKTVDLVDMELTGSSARNYVLAESGQQTTATADITPYDVIIEGLTAADKIYDGNNIATITGTPIIVSVYDGDDIDVVMGTARFEDAEIGDDKTVTFSGFGLSGEDADNYHLSAQPASVTADIRESTGYYTVLLDQYTYTYTGSAIEPSVTVQDGEVVIPSDEYTVSYSNNTDVTSSALVTVEDVEGGLYTITGTATFAITKANLTVTADNVSKHYGETDPALTYTVTGLVGGQSAASVMSGALAREAGEAVGTYNITRGTLACNDNYNIQTYTQGVFTIQKGTRPASTVSVQTNTTGEAGKTLDLASYIEPDSTLVDTSITGSLAPKITGVTFAGTTLTYTVLTNNGEIGNIVLTFSCSNYENYTVTVTVVPASKSTTVDIDRSGAPTSISAVASTNLSDYTSAQPEANVNVTLTVATKAASSLNPTTVAGINNTITGVFNGVGATGIGKEYLDIGVTKSVNGGAATPVTDLGRVIEIVITYDSTSKYKPMIIREHNGALTIFRSLATKPTSSSNYVDGTVYTGEAGKIYIYSQLFSVYSMAYSTVPACMVTYDDGFGGISQNIVQTGNRAVKPTDPTHSGYTFLGWYYAGNPWNFDMPITTDITFQAAWRANGSGGGSGGTTPDTAGSGTANGVVPGTAIIAPSGATISPNGAITTGAGAVVPRTGDPLIPVWVWVVFMIAGFGVTAFAGLMIETGSKKEE